MSNNYIKEMEESGYGAENISDFHMFCLPYLGDRFFPDKNLKILDIGSGVGHSLMPFKINGWRNLYAVDIDDFKKNFFEDNGIKFNKIDIEKEKLPFGNNFFDVVLSFHIIEHLNDVDNYLNEIRRVLKKNGIFILVTPDWRKQYKTFWRDHTHIHPYDKESISRLMKSNDFEPIFIKNFGVLRGLGRLRVYKIIKLLMFTGVDLIGVFKNNKN